MTHPREIHCISKLQNNARTTYARDWTSRTVSTVLAKQFSAAGDIPPSTSQQAICWHLPRKNSPETTNPSLKQHPNGFRHTCMANRYAYHHQLLYGQKTQNKWAEPLNPATHCDPILKSITLGPNGYLGIGHPPWKDSWNPILSIFLGPGETKPTPPTLLRDHHASCGSRRHRCPGAAGGNKWCWSREARSCGSQELQVVKHSV